MCLDSKLVTSTAVALVLITQFWNQKIFWLSSFSICIRPWYGKESIANATCGLSEGRPKANVELKQEAEDRESRNVSRNGRKLMIDDMVFIAYVNDSLYTQNESCIPL